MTTKQIVRFWIPLSVTWFFMAAEGPFLHTLLARMPDAKYNLAAFGLSFVIAMLIESPVINLLSAGVALAKDKASMLRLRSFMLWVNILVTVGMVVVVLPPVFSWIAYDVIDLIPEIAERLHVGLLWLIPWPGAIGIRRYYQGLLIRNNQTRTVAYGTAIRLGIIGISGVCLVSFTNVDGIVVGTASMTFAVIGEMIATLIMARRVVASYNNQDLNTCAEPPSTKKLLSFYTPLALTSAINFVMMPILSYFMNRAQYPVASLAVVPVINSFTFLFRSFGFSFQEVGIAFLGENTSVYPLVRKVALQITFYSSLVMAAIIFTPLGYWMLHDVVGLDKGLAEFARLPLMLMIVMPLTSAMFALQRSVLISVHRTVDVTIAAIIEVALVSALMAVLVWQTTFSGALAAGIAVAIARFAANGYTTVVSAKARRAW